MKYGLIGKTLVHSYSKEIHESLGKYTYELFSLAPEDVADFVKAHDFGGLNVTIPYKQDVIPLCDEISPLAASIGAVNTLYWKSAGTDGSETAVMANYNLRTAEVTDCKLRKTAMANCDPGNAEMTDFDNKAVNSHALNSNNMPEITTSESDHDNMSKFVRTCCSDTTDRETAIKTAKREDVGSNASEQSISNEDKPVFVDNRILVGHNTDYEGFLYTAKRSGIDFADKTILILGTGGTSLMARRAAADCGAEKIYIASRSGSGKNIALLSDDSGKITSPLNSDKSSTEPSTANTRTVYGNTCNSDTNSNIRICNNTIESNNTITSGITDCKYSRIANDRNNRTDIINNITDFKNNCTAAGKSSLANIIKNTESVSNCNNKNKCSDSTNNSKNCCMIMQLSYEALPEIAPEISIIVNTTPVGTFPNNLKSVISVSDFPKCEAVIDVIYNPFKTRLLMDAEKAGLKTANGLPMLVAQATAAAGYFLGTPGAFESENERIIGELVNRMKNIVLIGMPGCGKSTIGRIIAAQTGKTFVDMDEEIIKKTGKPIPKIFEEVGETGFRDIESQVAAEIGKQRGLVIATGGGAILRPENVDALKQNGTIIHILRPVDSLPTDGRPLSKNIETLRNMEKSRLPLYEAAADVTFDNSARLNANDLKTAVCNLLQKL